MLDRLWLYRSEKRSEEVVRKKKRGTRQVEEEAAIEEEGLTYGAGEF